MSVSSPDHIVLPEDDEARPATAEAAAPETPAAGPDAAGALEAAEAATAPEAAAPETPAGTAHDAESDTRAAHDADADESAPREVTFADLGLPDGVVRKLAQNGVTSPFPIQAATIPDALAGKDILGRGRTGSGKTLSFGLPLLATLAGGYTEKKHPRGVILTPTRELAMQVADALQPYGDVLGLRMKVVCGGTSMGNQIYALERGVDILVATPGRLRDIIGRGACSLDSVQVAVLDEADQMADLGFLPEVTELLDQVPEGGQRMLFSATLDNDIDTLIKRYLHAPVTHEVDPSAGAVTTMTHHILIVKPRDKAPVTAAIAARKGRTIVFVRTQMGADRIAEQLRDAGVRAEALHGGMTQGARTRTLADFKDGYVNVLVATDVAARGIHVDGIDLVLNVDPAGDHKDYLHRSGRTARAGRSGTVVSLALPHQRRQTFRLMEDAGVDASRHIVGGGGAFDPEVAAITGARSMTEVQAESAGREAKQAERDVKQLTKELERAQRRATELREEADRLTLRAARERGEEPPVRAQAQSSGSGSDAGPGSGSGSDSGAGAGAGFDAGTAAGSGSGSGSGESAAGAGDADASAGSADGAAAGAGSDVVSEPASGAGSGVGGGSIAAEAAEIVNVGIVGTDVPAATGTTESSATTATSAPATDAARPADAGSSVSVPRQSGPRDSERDGRGRDDRPSSSYQRASSGGRPYDRDRSPASRGSYDRGDRYERGDRDRGRGFDRRDGDRGGFRRDNDRGPRSYDRRDDRGDRGNRGYDRRDDRGNYRRDNDRNGFRRDNDRGERGGFRRDDRGRGFDRRDGDRGGFTRDNDRGPRSYDRRDDRGDRGNRGYDRRDDRGNYRRDNDRTTRPYDRDERGGRGDRGDRGGFRRDNDRGERGGFRRDDRSGYRGGDRPFNRDRPSGRDRQGDRPSGGHRTGGHDRPGARRDDHRGGPGNGSGSGAGAGAYRRREDKPRWKRKG